LTRARFGYDRSMRIERLSLEETSRLRSVRLRALADAPNAFDSTLEEAQHRTEEEWRQQLSGLATFVAVVDGADVGMARGGPDSADPQAAWLLSMWVDPGYRGRGIGDALVTAVVDWARADGFRRLMLEVGDSNHAAIALYARHGFDADGGTSRLRPPRHHISEHRRVRLLGTSIGG